ncbi:AsmA family protein [Tahibacter caeni]|uniref:AsmA family protein n=1 Tax=Tahibacter caeni TaxID=1453545 RepID=UPI0027D25B21|nr:AsmA family protein [Tahibacter caeni]
MRLRRPLRIAAAVLALPAIALALLLHEYARPERVAALLTEQTESRLGLTLAFRPPARYALWPRLRLQLDDARFGLPGETTPLLSLQRLDVSLPWSSLRDSRLLIEELRLQQPQLELSALLRWLERGDDANATPPDLRVHLVVTDASLQQDGKAVASQIGFDGDIDAQQLQRWWRELVEAAPQANALPPLPGSARIGRIELDGVRLEGIRIESGPAQ